MITKAEMLQRTIDAIRKGKKPMRYGVFAPVYGLHKNMYEHNGEYFSTPKELNDHLEQYEVIDGKRNIVLVFPEEVYPEEAHG